MRKFFTKLNVAFATVLFAGCLALVSISCSDNARVDTLQEGDIVFIESQSSQSPYIKAGTMSKWTHCGVVVNTPEGLKVLEASKTVMLTPFAKFIGAAKNDNWCIRRPKQKISAPINYHKYLGQPYDLEFKFDNGKMYCSELVWMIYKEQNIELCNPRKVSSFAMTRLPKVKKLMDMRGISMDQKAVAPVDIYKAI